MYIYIHISSDMGLSPMIGPGSIYIYIFIYIHIYVYI